MPKQISDRNFYRQTLKRRQKIKCFKCRDLSLSVTGVPHVPKPNTEHSWVPVCCAVHEEQLYLLDGQEKLWNEEYDKGGTQCLKSRMLLIPAAAQLQIAKSTRCWPRAGKLHGSRSSEGIWLRFCREKHERKIMWNKMMLGMWSGWSGWRRRQESSEQALIWDNEQRPMNKKNGKYIRSLSPLQFNFFTVWWWGFKPKHEWVKAVHCVLVSGCPWAADTKSEICDLNVLSLSNNRCWQWSEPQAE